MPDSAANPAPPPAFTLDPRLEASTYRLGELPLCEVLLHDDARFFWLVLVPKRADKAELLDLSAPDQQALFDEIRLVAGAMQTTFTPDKLNIGALGNIVRQLHVHIVARFASDAAWPGPVWGHGERVPYAAHNAGMMLDKLRKALDFKT